MNSPRNTAAPALLAPGAASSVQRAYAPGRGDPLPAVDERLVAPEAHAQIIDGRVISTMGANEPHATEHTEVTHVLRACLAPGYRVAVDMLTRMTRTTDAAPDVSVFPAERDPLTGGRQLEEIAFEIADTESTAHVAAKARKLAARGVRRVFYVRVEDRVVHEWDAAEGAWQAMLEEATITDRCFTIPVPVKAMADQMLADETVVRVVLARRHPLLVAEMTRERDEGELRGRRAALRTVMRARGLAPDPDDDARIEACRDLAALDRWIAAAAAATLARDVFDRDQSDR